MCGIVGVVSRERLTDSQTSWLRGATRSLERRGPDGEGIELTEQDGLGFGHRRLSIIDLSSGGHQPMHSLSGRYVLTYNGEIYNYREIRKELVGRGIAFRSDSDTEVMLAAFDEFGIENALVRFDGMFAFGLFDRRSKKLVLGRDRFGEKPLVFCVVGGALFFSSEVRQLRSVSGFDSTIDTDAANSVMDVGYVRQDKTIYVGAERVLPGEFIEWDCGRVTRKIWWDPIAEAAKVAKRTTAPALSELDQVLRGAVSSRMVSDVPLGVFLSGGIDSSLVAALAQATSSQSVKTFTIGVEDEQRSEAVEAAAIAKHLGTDHHTLVATDRDALEIVPLLASMYDEPFADSSQIPTHLVSKLARSHITVALTGDGGDELFGGYNRHMLAKRLERHFGSPRARLARIGASAVGSIPPTVVRGAFAGARRVGVLKSYKGDPVDALSKAARLGSAKDGLELYSQMVFTGGSAGRVGRGLDRTSQAWSQHDFRLADRMMLSDTVSYLPGDILTKVDRASMFVGLETRAPFLSPAVFDLAWSTPLNSKLNSSTGKHLLRQVLGTYVPETMWNRPKTGFGVPISDWLVGPLQSWANEIIAQMPTRIGKDQSVAVTELWTQRPANWQHAVWNSLMLTSWLISVDGQSSEERVF
jgi:asparagine synthase (glutamine-hydrolysing)